MSRLLLLCCFALVFTSCGSSKKTTRHHTPTATKTDRIISNAQTYTGTPYVFGGTTAKGMDCSGLIYTAFLKEEVQLPRVSRDMAKRGKPISLKVVQKGDLIFFRTNKSSRQINHVGLVTTVTSGNIYFIHSTSSRGVITSSLDEKYWATAFVQARRVL